MGHAPVDQGGCAAIKTFGVKAALHPVNYGATRPALIGGSPAQRAGNRRVIIYVND